MQEKAIIFSAPSGAGKTTIVKEMLLRFPQLAFSISACNRPARLGEKHAKDYYFFTTDVFKQHITDEHFLEWEEVYDGRMYGTLHSEITRLWQLGKVVVFDVDVVGGLTIKSFFKEKALSLFIEPPSLTALETRLKGRGTETTESLKMRLSKAKHELSFASKFDKVVVNDNLSDAFTETENNIRSFLAT